MQPAWVVQGVDEAQQEQSQGRACHEGCREGAGIDADGLAFELHEAGMRRTVIAHRQGRSGHAFEADEADLGLLAARRPGDHRTNALFDEVGGLDRYIGGHQHHAQRQVAALHIRLEPRQILRRHAPQQLISVVVAFVWRFFVGINHGAAHCRARAIRSPSRPRPYKRADDGLHIGTLNEQT